MGPNNAHANSRFENLVRAVLRVYAVDGPDYHDRKEIEILTEQHGCPADVGGRKHTMRKALSMIVALLMVFAAVPTVAQAVNSSVQSVALTMNVGETLTLTATPATITFTYVPGSNTATASGPITTTAT